MFNIMQFIERVLFVLLLLFVATCRIAHPVWFTPLKMWRQGRQRVSGIITFKVGSPVPAMTRRKRNYISGRYTEPGWCN